VLQVKRVLTNCAKAYLRLAIQADSAQLKRETRGVSHCGFAIYIKKVFKTKEELWK
jgi:hypothetical protein